MDDRGRQVDDVERVVLSGLLEQAINNLWLGVILFSRSREVIYCNKRYREMYGLKPRQVRPGTPVGDLIQHRLKLGLKIRGEADAYIRARTEGTVVSERTVQEFADGRIIASPTRCPMAAAWPRMRTSPSARSSVRGCNSATCSSTSRSTTCRTGCASSMPATG